MKKQNKRTPKAKLIKELAVQFQTEMDQKLPLTILQDGGIVYKDYLIKQTKQENWGLYHISGKTLIETYFLKTCAIMAAKAYEKTNLNKFFEIKRVDNKYWASHCDLQVYRNNIKAAKDFDRYLILLNKLEDSQTKEAYYKDEISKMFKWTFV